MSIEQEPLRSDFPPLKMNNVVALPHSVDTCRLGDSRDVLCHSTTHGGKHRCSARRQAAERCQRHRAAFALGFGLQILEDIAIKGLEVSAPNEQLPIAMDGVCVDHLGAMFES